MHAVSFSPFPDSGLKLLEYTQGTIVKRNVLVRLRNIYIEYSYAPMVKRWWFLRVTAWPFSTFYSLQVWECSDFNENSSRIADTPYGILYFRILAIKGSSGNEKGKKNRLLFRLNPKLNFVENCWQLIEIQLSGNTLQYFVILYL